MATVSSIAKRALPKSVATRRCATKVAAASSQLRRVHVSAVIRAGKENTNTDKTFRYPIAWKDPDFYNEQKLEQEMRRVFDVCHGCRLCYSLCDSFPTLFDLIDESKTGELDSVPSSKFKKVVDDCTLCDLCFLTKCPYVPPHGLNVDFPHLMLRYRAVENQKANIPPEGLSKPTEFASVEESTGSKLNMREKVHVEEGLDRSLKKESQSWTHGLYTSTDLMGRIMTKIPWLANWVTSKDSPAIFKRLLKEYAGISENAALPTYVSAGETFVNAAKSVAVTTNPNAPASGKRKVVLFATCIVNYNKPDIGHAARAVLAHNGVEVKVEYPMCCGMPQFESGLVQDVSKKAEEFAQKMRKYVDQGYEFVTPTASCTLMLKKEWPLLLPLDENVKLLSQKTYDIGEYVVLVSKQHGLTQEGLRELPEAITLHHACHQRAQGAGFKSQEMLQMIPNIKISSVERCSGHGGSFGVQVKGHESAMKVGKPVFRNTIRNMQETTNSGINPTAPHLVSSDCPLAMDHIKHGVTQEDKSIPESKIVPKHPIEIMAKAYGLVPPSSKTCETRFVSSARDLSKSPWIR